MLDTRKENILNLDEETNFEDEDKKLDNIEENCDFEGLNYIDNRNIILGYPIQRLNNGVLIPIPEILSKSNAPVKQ